MAEKIFKVRGEGCQTPEGKHKAIMQTLEDGRPHSVSEIASCTNIPAEEVERFLQFLAKYSFITYDKRKKTAVICDDFLSLG